MRKRKDITGKIFGELIAIKFVDVVNTNARWLFQCTCGNQQIININAVTSGRKQKTCGNNIHKIKDITGEKFGRLTALFLVERKGDKTLWLFKCDCGIEKIIDRHNVVGGYTVSCGCYNKERAKEIGRLNKTHGLSQTRFYEKWAAIIGRTTNVKDKYYKDYGKRGIKCEWNNFMEFKDAMYESYLKHVEEFGIKNTTIERKDVNGNYNLENCTWATPEEQANNRRNNKKITFKGETLNQREWEKRYGLPSQMIYNRLRQGWTIEKAILSPNKKK